MNDKFRPECKGCASRIYKFEDPNLVLKGPILCRIPQNVNGINCPCMVCLIKGVCEEDCPDLDEYRATSMPGIYKNYGLQND